MKTAQEIFESKLDIEAKRIFCALPEEEKRRIVAVRFPPALKDADEDIAILNATIYNGIIKSRLYANAEEVETFGLVDVVTSRGWVRYKDVYASPRRRESWERIEAQEEADARDLELGRNFGRKLDQLTAQGDRIEKTAVETHQGVGVLIQHLPDAKKPTVISWAEATEIFMPGTFIKRGDQFVRTKEERKKAVDSFRRNCSNWIKSGVAGRSKLPIAWDNLATTNTWKKWVESYVIAERKAIIVSERAGKAEAAEKRRKGIIT